MVLASRTVTETVLPGRTRWLAWAGSWYVASIAGPWFCVRSRGTADV